MNTRLTKEPWFGPKQHLGWGWRVASWQGRLISALFLAFMVAAAIGLHGSARTIALIGLLALFGMVVLVTGDPPGGPGAQ